MTQRLSGKVVILTGGTRGMGEAQVRAFVREGAKVVFGGRDEAPGKRIEQELDGQALFVRQDVSVRADWVRLIDITMSRFGRIDGLVNNAGFSLGVLLEDTTDDQIAEVIGINQLGTLYGMQHVVGPMRDVGAGSIVNIGSPCATRGIPTTTVYSGAKAAIVGMTLAAAKELAAEQIRVNVVHPGYMATRMLTDVMGESARELGASATPLGRVGEPEDIVGAIVFLLSDESRFVTGAEIKVDGGSTL